MLNPRPKKEAAREGDSSMSEGRPSEYSGNANNPRGSAGPVAKARAKRVASSGQAANGDDGRRPRPQGGGEAGDSTGTSAANAAPAPFPDAEGNPAVADDRLQRLQREVDNLTHELAQTRRRLHTSTEKGKLHKHSMTQLVVSAAKTLDADERERVEASQFQLGRCRPAVVPSVSQPTWDGGYEAEEIGITRDRIKEDKNCIDKLRRRQKQSAKRPRVANPATGEEIGGTSGSSSTAQAQAQTPPPAQPFSSTSWFAADDAGVLEEASDEWELRDIFRFRMETLTKEENLLKERENRLGSDRQLYSKQSQRLEAADRSSFRDYPLLSNQRYQLLNMIGRGGFSEVYKAYDLDCNTYCAVKIHELGSEMSDQQRQAYIRRAMREYDIHKNLKHPRVVTLMDCFPISEKAFATVLELCEGDTLDEYLKRHGQLPEKEARGIIIQLLSGLKYLNTDGRKIIHYDIKPGNIFFREGEVKIADFGLSKVVQDDSHCPSIELTSQGAGTFWYLPPECIFPGTDLPAKISNKVDVWSTGVVFFETLFKRRPFGHGQPQDLLIRGAICGGVSFDVQIPNAPKVSEEGKKFLKRLLTVQREQRPDVFQAYSDPYLRPRTRANTTSTALVLTGCPSPRLSGPQPSLALGVGTDPATGIIANGMAPPPLPGTAASVSAVLPAAESAAPVDATTLSGTASV